jgi:hypothetical protein
MEAVELLNFFTRKNDLVVQNVNRQKEDKRQHKCNGCAYGRFVSDTKVFCLLPRTCIKDPV